MRPLALKPGEGVSVDNPVGGVLTFKVTSDQSGGQLTAIETVAAPGEGPLLHVHSDEDEFIYILEGAFKVKLENDLITATPGSFVFIPRGTPHAWQNVSDASARFLAGVMPAAIGFEGFFARYAQLPAEERGTQAFARLASQTKAFELIGPPLAQSDPH
jgi:quercetin dioxygenase-like cupin family protein